jgi:hypothetical protein
MFNIIVFKNADIMLKKACHNPLCLVLNLFNILGLITELKEPGKRNGDKTYNTQ